MEPKLLFSTQTSYNMFAELLVSFSRAGGVWTETGWLFLSSANMMLAAALINKQRYWILCLMYHRNINKNMEEKAQLFL